jgi:hypothetical protein
MTDVRALGKWLIAGLLLQSSAQRDPQGATLGRDAPSTTDARFAALARFLDTLQAAPVFVCEARGSWWVPDPEVSQAATRWSIETQVWMKKGGRIQARTSWWLADEEAPQAHIAPDAARRVLHLTSDDRGVHAWFEGDPTSERLSTTPAGLVPFPLPELFASFESDPGPWRDLAQDAGAFTWEAGQESQLRLLMPGDFVAQAREEPARRLTWVALEASGARLRSSCALLPSADGTSVLHLRYERLEALEKWPADLQRPQLPVPTLPPGK